MLTFLSGYEEGWSHLKLIFVWIILLKEKSYCVPSSVWNLVFHGSQEYRQGPLTRVCTIWQLALLFCGLASSHVKIWVLNKIKKKKKPCQSVWLAMSTQYLLAFVILSSPDFLEREPSRSQLSTQTSNLPYSWLPWGLGKWLLLSRTFFLLPFP